MPDIALTDNVGVKLLMHTGAAGGHDLRRAGDGVHRRPPNVRIRGANLIAIADVNGDGSTT